jgi:hypothetical protein
MTDGPAARTLPGVRERGQTSIELAGVLLVIGLVFAALFASGFMPEVANAAKQAVCTIVNAQCEEAPAPPAGPPAEPPEGPAPIDFDLPFPVLPFPGSLSVSCNYSTSSQGACRPNEPGVSVGTEGKLTIERSPTTLDDKGCPTQQLSVKASLELQANASGETPHASGGLTALLGEASSYSVTVPPDQADAIEAGTRGAPNPIDPRSIRAGESVELTQEFYAGHKLDASYRALQLQLGYEKGTKVSAGVSRQSPSTVRIYVGDEDFVRNALSIGVGNDAAGVALAAGAELSDGKLHSIDVDISTSAGWKAYQAFLTSGRLPSEGTPGTADPTRSDVFKFSDKTQIEAHIGNLSVGGILAESGANGVETHNADGSVDTSYTAHFNDAGVAVTTHQDAGGEPVPTRYSLLLENVSESSIETWETFSGQKLAHNGSNVRFDFTPEDFATIQAQAWDQLVHEQELWRTGVDEDTLREIMAEYPHGGDPYGVDRALSQTYEIAAAKTPEEVLYQLYLGAGPGRDGDVGMMSLVDFMQATAAARHGLREVAADHPDSILPGASVAPDCG